MVAMVAMVGWLGGWVNGEDEGYMIRDGWDEIDSWEEYI